MVYKTPRDLVFVTTNAALVKAGMRWDQIVVLGFQAGVFIAFGSILATVVTANTEYDMFHDWPGAKKLIFAGVFPVGLLAVVIVGGELFTSNTAYMLPAYLQGTINLKDLLRNYVLSYMGNFIGAVFAAWILAYEAGLFEAEPYKHAAIGIAEKKMHHTWGVAFCRAIGCNYLVCIAVWQSLAADDIAGKILAIWFPTMAFVALGYEHCVANMYFCTVGIMLGSEKTFGDFIVENLIPVTLGNILGGAGFIAGIYYYVYMFQPPWVEVEEEEAEEAVVEEKVATPAVEESNAGTNADKSVGGTVHRRNVRPSEGSRPHSRASFLAQNWSEVDGTANKVELIPFHRDAATGHFAAGDIKEVQRKRLSMLQNPTFGSKDSLIEDVQIC